MVPTFIREGEHGYIPCVRELGVLLSVFRKSAVHSQVKGVSGTLSG